MQTSYQKGYISNNIYYQSNPASWTNPNNLCNPEKETGCSTNQFVPNLPVWWPRKITNLGPNSLKHIYGGTLCANGTSQVIPGYYPNQYVAKPIDTMYRTFDKGNEKSSDLRGERWKNIDPKIYKHYANKNWDGGCCDDDNLFYYNAIGEPVKIGFQVYPYLNFSPHEIRSYCNKGQIQRLPLVEIYQ